MAVGTYTVAEPVERGRTYENKKGAGNLTVWRLALEDAQPDTPGGLFELHKKEDSKPPAAGDQIEVKRFQKGEFNGDNFIRIYQEYADTRKATTGGGGPRGGDGGDGPGLTWQNKPYNSSAEHPRNEARVIHTASLSNVTAFIEQMLTIGVADQPQTWDDYWKLVGKVATKLTRSYEAAMSMEPQQPLPVAAQEVPADTGGLEPQTVAATDDVPF